MYYWINGRTFVGPNLDNANYPNIEPVTWKKFMTERSMEGLAGSFFSLASNDKHIENP